MGQLVPQTPFVCDADYTVKGRNRCLTASARGDGLVFGWVRCPGTCHLASQSPAYEVGTPPSRCGVVCKVGQTVKAKKHPDPCWQLPDSPGSPAMSHRMCFCLLFQVNGFTNPTLAGQRGRPTLETTGLKTFSGERGGERSLPDPLAVSRLNRGPAVAVRSLRGTNWASFHVRGAEEGPALRPQLLHSLCREQFRDAGNELTFPSLSFSKTVQPSWKKQAKQV